jgi:hypothetical protein
MILHWCTTGVLAAFSLLYSPNRAERRFSEVRIQKPA